MTLKIIRCTERRFDEMIAFIGEHNPTGEHHIGYFGVTPADTRESVRMLNLRFDRGFWLAFDDRRLVGVMGVDIDKDIGRAWLYGPVIVADAWMETADALYEAVQAAIPVGINEHEMFVDALNANCRAYAARHGFDSHGEMAIYYITPGRLAALPEGTADEWDGRFANQLAALHDRLFPRSNYTLAYMLAELEKGATLLTLADGGRLVGYFSGRAEPESGEAYVDLVGVDEDHRRSGLGRRLMLAGLSRLRRMPGLRQVNLTVEGGNDPAMRLYDSLGFLKERDMVAFRKQVKPRRHNMEKEKHLSFQVLDDADLADIDFVRNGLRHYNSLFAEESYKPLYIFLRDADGMLVGGLLADTYWGWLSVNILWLDEGFRGQGFGERLLAAAEEEARRRGCTHAHLDTLSFQARPFYEKLGYRVYGALEDFPTGSGHTRYYLTKDIQTGER